MGNSQSEQEIATITITRRDSQFIKPPSPPFPSSASPSPSPTTSSTSSSTREKRLTRSFTTNAITTAHNDDVAKTTNGVEAPPPQSVAQALGYVTLKSRTMSSKNLKSNIAPSNSPNSDSPKNIIPSNFNSDTNINDSKNNNNNSPPSSPKSLGQLLNEAHHNKANDKPKPTNGTPNKDNLTSNRPNSPPKNGPPKTKPRTKSEPEPRTEPRIEPIAPEPRTPEPKIKTELKIASNKDPANEPPTIELDSNSTNRELQDKEKLADKDTTNNDNQGDKEKKERKSIKHRASQMFRKRRDTKSSAPNELCPTKEEDRNDAKNDNNNNTNNNSSSSSSSNNNGNNDDSEYLKPIGNGAGLRRQSNATVINARALGIIKEEGEVDTIGVEEKQKEPDGAMVAASESQGKEKEKKKKRKKVDKAMKERINKALQSIDIEDEKREVKVMKEQEKRYADFTTPNGIMQLRYKRFSDSLPPSIRDSPNFAEIRRASFKVEESLRNSIKTVKLAPPPPPEVCAAVKIQATFRMWRAVKSYKKLLLRTTVVREILITELDYVRFLSVLVKVYYHPMRKLKVLTPEEIKSIFPQIEVIQLYNSKFADIVQRRLREWTYRRTIGDVFLTMIDFLKEPYTVYISQFPEITEKINTCSKRDDVAHFLRKCTKFTEVASMDLLSLASMPFQRIPRYILLLKEALKYTEPANRDYELLRVAIKKLDLLTKAASERLRLEENTKSVLRVNAMLDPPVENLVRPYRKLLRDGTLDACFIPNSMKTTSPSSTSAPTKLCRMFLFNDCVLLAHEKKKSTSFLFGSSDSELKLKPVAVLDLRGAVVLDVADPKNEFRIRVQTGVAILQTKNWPEKEAWRSDVTEAIDALAHEDPEVRTIGRSLSATRMSPSDKGADQEKQEQGQGEPQQHEKIARTRSHAFPSKTLREPKKKNFHSWLSAASSNANLTLRKQNAPAATAAAPRISRQFSMPQISALFPQQKFAAPAPAPTPVVKEQRIQLGRVPSYNSFFLKKKQSAESAPKQPTKTQSLSGLSPHLKPIILLPPKPLP